MDRQKQCMPKARSPVKEADAFVVFDEARCRRDASFPCDVDRQLI